MITGNHKSNHKIEEGDDPLWKSVEETLLTWIGEVNGYVWGWPTLILLVGTGIFLTLRLGFLQVRTLPYALKLVFSRNKKDETAKGDISHFQSLMTALAATIGTGNIAGVATAVATGGPGAIFWMWITALFGMATKYAEAILAVKYRTTNEKGQISGGPMYYIERGLGMKWLAILFALFGSIAAFGIGNMVQSHSVASALTEVSGNAISPGVTGLVLGNPDRIGSTGWNSLHRPDHFLCRSLHGCVLYLGWNHNYPA